MANVQEQEVRRYVLKKDRAASSDTRHVELKDMRENEIMSAVRQYGVEAIIKEYREVKAEPPVDILLAYLYQKPDDISKDESELLQKAYGWGFIADVYRQLGKNDLSEISTWGKIKGWFGRKFGSYKKVNKFENHSLAGAPSAAPKNTQGDSAVSKLKQAENQLFQGIQKMEAGEAVEENTSVNALVEQGLEVIERLTNSESAEGEDNERTEGPETEAGSEPSQNMSVQDQARQLAENAVTNESSNNLVQSEEPIHAISTESSEDQMDYNGYIRLYGYKGYEFEEGIMQYRSQNIALVLPAGLVYNLKNTDFTLIYDSKAPGKMAVMSKGDAALSLGMLQLSATHMKYTDLDDTFLADEAAVGINEAFFDLKANAAVEHVKINRSGISFDEFTADLKDFSLFNKTLNIANPKFHMKKENKWMKDISIGGLSIKKDNVSLNFSGNEEGSQGTWMLKEENGETVNVGSSETQWVPYITGGNANLEVGALFQVNIPNIFLDQEKVTANGDIKINLDWKLPGSQKVTAEMTIQNILYKFGDSSLSWGNMSGNADIPVGNTVLKTAFQNVVYNQAGLGIGSLESSVIVENKTITVGGKNIIYTKEQGLSFEQLSGNVEGDINIGSAFTLKNIKAALSKNGEDGSGYAVTLEAGAEAKKGKFSLTAKNTKFTVSGSGINDAQIVGAALNIDNNTIYGEAGNVDYSRANNIISASDLKAKFSTAEGTEVNVNVGSLKYEEQAFFLQGLNGDLSFNLGSLSMTAGITDGSYDQSGFSVPSATGNISVKGKNIALSGTELKYSKDAGFDFKTLEGGVEGNVEVFSGFTLKEGKVSVSKGADSGEVQGEQGEAGAGGTSPISVTLEAGVEAKNGKFSLTAKNTKFTVSDDGVNDAHIVNAILDIDNTIHGEVGNLDYSKENNVISATDLSVDFSTAKGTAVKVNVGSLKYEEKAFSLQGISGDLSINLGGTSMTAKITGGSYDQNGFSVQSAAGNISVLGKNINLSGTNLKYSKEAGFDFKTLGGAIEGNTEIFPGFTLLGGKVSAAKGEAGEGENGTSPISVTVEAGVEAKRGKFNLTADNAQFTVTGNILSSAEIKNATLDIDNHTVYGKAENVNYLGESKAFSAAGLALGFSVTGGPKADVNVGSLKYEEQAFALQGIKGYLSFSLGSLSMTAGVTGGSYDQSGFSVQTVTGNVLALGKNIALSGTELKYSKDAGLDFKTLEGEVGGNVEVFPGFILTGGKISAVKGAALEAGQEENGEAAGGASPISVTVEAGVEAKNGKFSLTAKNTKFTALKDGINDAHIIDAALDIDNHTVHGTVGNADYSKANHMISASDLTAGFSTANGTEVNIKVGNLKYEEQDFNLQGLKGDLSFSLGSLSMTANVSNGSYDQNGFSVQSADGNILALGKNIALSGTELKYSKEAGFDFKTLGGEVKGNLQVFSGFNLTEGKVSAVKGEAGAGENGASPISVTVEAGVEAKKEKFSLTAKNTKFTILGDGINDAHIVDAALDIDNNTVHGTVGNVDYSKANHMISASDLTAGFSTSNGTEANIKVGSLKYEEQAFSLQGIGGNLSFGIGSILMNAKVENGSYDQNGLFIQSASGNIVVMDKTVTLLGEDLKYNKAEGFDFKKLEGKLEGNLQVFSGFNLTEGKVSAVKGETGAGENGASPISITVEAGVEAKKEKFSLTAKNAKVSVSGNTLAEAHMENAVLDVDNHTVYGEVGKADYSGESKALSAADLIMGFSTSGGTKADVKVGSLKYEEKAFSLQGLSGELSFSLGNVLMNTKVENGSYDQSGLFVQTATGNILVMGKTLILSGEELKYNKETGFDFKKIQGGVQGDLELFSGFKLTGVEASAEKGGAAEGAETNSAPVSVILTAGVGADIKNIINITADKASLSVYGDNLGDTVVEQAKLNIKNGLINAESEKINLSPKQKKISAQNLKFSAGGSADGIGPLSNVAGFLNLKEVGVTVGQVSYEQGTGLAYNGFIFNPASINIGTDNLGMLVDFGNNRVEGHLKWQYPGDGEAVGAGEKDEDSHGVNVTEESGGFQAPRIIGVDVNVPIPMLPGVYVGGGLAVGAGFQLAGQVGAQKENQGSGQENDGSIYGLDGQVKLDANAWIGANLHVGLGGKIASLEAGVLAKLGLNLSALSGLNVKVHKTGTELKVQNGRVTYKMAAQAEFVLSAYVKAKLLFFKERTLCQKNLGVWNLGNLELSGALFWDGNNLKIEEPKKSVILGGKTLEKGSLEDTKITTTDQDIAQLPDKQSEEKLENLLNLEEERKKAEDALLDQDVLWGTSGGEAAQAVVNQIKRLAELYEQNLTLLSKRIETLTKESNQALLGTGESFIEIQLSKEIAEKTYALAKKEAEEKHKKQFFGAYSKEIDNIKHLYRKEYREVYLGYVKRMIVTLIGQNEKYFAEQPEGRKSGKNCQNEIEKLNKITDLSALASEKDIKAIWSRCQSIPGWQDASQSHDSTEHNQIITNILGSLESKYDLEKTLNPYLYTETSYHTIYNTQNEYQKEKMQEQMMKDKELAEGPKGSGRDTEVFGKSEQGILAYTSAMIRAAGERQREAVRNYEEKFRPFQKAEESRNAALEEKGRVLQLKGKIDGFLAVPAEELGGQRDKFKEISSTIREYKIKEELEKLKNAENDFIEARPTEGA
ncbi:hypothetical protein [Lachnoclostridium edouardi]|uniref:hypothetical protein n=1 Tax=Lachnoclostridium edouardi TaxID=1926283 RepID=UPI000C7CB4D9|nr:hypothetical protein [Lachnoclostridium edouardi]